MVANVSCSDISDKHRERQRDTSVKQKLVEMNSVVDLTLLQTALTMGKPR